ncbi:MAG TPA: hypothetical protein VJ600_11075 [Holophagaceae bacterium]|nr:hypothetical protein [Holophagaceae bacterium]
MGHLLGRAITFLLGSALWALAFLMFKHREDWYGWIEGFRDRNPILRAMNPLSDLNTPALSRWSLVWGAFVATLMGALLLVVSILGRVEH